MVQTPCCPLPQPDGTEVQESAQASCQAVPGPWTGLTQRSSDSYPVLNEDGLWTPVLMNSLSPPQPFFCSRVGSSLRLKSSPKCCRECLVLGHKGFPKANRNSNIYPAEGPGTDQLSMQNPLGFLCPSQHLTFL